MRSDVTPLIPAPDEPLVRPLPAGAEPWQRAVWRDLRRNAPRFEGRPDRTGVQGRAFIAAVREALTGADRATFPQVVTGLRIRMVRAEMAVGQETNMSVTVSNLTAANVVRDLHEQVIRTVEMAA